MGVCGCVCVRARACCKMVSFVVCVRVFSYYRMCSVTIECVLLLSVRGVCAIRAHTQLRFGLDEEMLAVLEAHWSPKGVCLCVSLCLFDACVCEACI